MKSLENRERKFLEMLDNLGRESSELSDMYEAEGNEEKRIYYFELYLKLNSIYVDLLADIDEDFRKKLEEAKNKKG